MNNTSANRKWKSKLLSSSLPLEFEVLKQLEANKFNCDLDYSFTRHENAIAKEFSFDILAEHHLWRKESEYKTKKFVSESNLILAVECKYRAKEKALLFLPDIYDTGRNLNRTAMTSQLNFVDNFCLFNIEEKFIEKFESKIPRTLKGVEINLSDGDVSDKDLRHGLNQLRYAIPNLLFTQIKFATTFLDIDENLPFLLVPILVTNADLYVLSRDVDIESISKCDSIDQISKKVEFLSVHTSVGPDLSQHYQHVFKNFSDTYISESKIIEVLIKKRLKSKNKNVSPFADPNVFTRDLELGNEQIINELFSRVIVCNVNSFTTFICNLRDAARKDTDLGKRI